MSEQQSFETLFEFPCEFPIKIMANNNDELKDFVRSTLISQGVASDAIDLNVRHSKEGNYLSVSAIFTAESKAQLDAIYQALIDHPDVKMVL